MATMPHEGVLQHAREALPDMGMATAVAIRKGRAPAKPAAQRKLGRRPPRVARPRAAIRTASANAANRPAKPLQGVDYSKLQTALEVLIAPNPSHQPTGGTSVSPFESAGEDHGAGVSHAWADGSRVSDSLRPAVAEFGEKVDDGTCEERVTLLGPNLRGKIGWGPAAAAKWKVEQANEKI